jgi:hypothetical protein
MASRLKAAAAAKLARQAAGDFGPIPSKPSQYAAIQPDAAAYNVFGPQYAASLAADTGVPAANILNQRALRVDSEEENQRYMDAIAAANENQRYLQNAAAIAEQKGRIGDHDLDPTINKTIGTATVDDQGYIQVEPHAAGVQTAENLNSEHAKTLQDTAAAAKDLYGIGVKLPDLGYMIAPANQKAPTATKDITVQVDMGEGIPPVEMTTDDANKYYDAKRRNDAAMVAALAAKYHAMHPSNTGGPKVVTHLDPEHRVSSIDITTPGADPPEYTPNPNADVQGSGTSAKPSAATLPALDLAPIKKIGAEFGTVTSTKRDPKHNRDVGGVPNSYHLSGHAIDIARHKGVSHAAIKAAYENAGYKLIESLDEGDHSHFAFASGPSHNGEPQQRRPVQGGAERVIALAQAKGYRHSVVNGNVVVQLPSGKQLVYDSNGMKVGASQ